MKCPPPSWVEAAEVTTQPSILGTHPSILSKLFLSPLAICRVPLHLPTEVAMIARQGRITIASKMWMALSKGRVELIGLPFIGPHRPYISGRLLRIHCAEAPVSRAQSLCQRQ